MNGLTRDFIAIDTNVFAHLTNENMNTDNHIHKLLRMPKKEDNKINLLVDADRSIFSEYNRHLKVEYLDAQQRKNEAQIIRYWIRLAPKKKVVIDKKGQLWGAIHAIIPEKDEEIDRIFVYVAFKMGRILVSNDYRHIVNRRKQLKTCCTNGHCGEEADVMCSIEAYKQMQNLGD